MTDQQVAKWGKVFGIFRGKKESLSDFRRRVENYLNRR